MQSSWLVIESLEDVNVPVKPPGKTRQQSACISILLNLVDIGILGLILILDLKVAKILASTLLKMGAVNFPFGRLDHNRKGTL